MLNSFFTLLLILVTCSTSVSFQENNHLKNTEFPRKHEDETWQREIEGNQGYYQNNDDGNGGNQQAYNNDDDDVYLNGVQKYFAQNASESYHSRPDNWGFHQWVVFSLALFAFGTVFCLGCSFCIVPCICPAAGRGYVRMFN